MIEIKSCYSDYGKMSLATNVNLKQMIKLSKTKIDRPFLNQENYKLLGDWCLDNDGGVLQQRHFLPKVKYHWDDKTKYNTIFTI